MIGSEEEESTGLVSDSSSWPMNNIGQPGENDVIFGRGAGTNKHPGNIKWRKMIANRESEYKKIKGKDSTYMKHKIVEEIVTQVRELTPPGRFLNKESKKNEIWYDVGDQKAIEKTAQALRDMKRKDAEQLLDSSKEGEDSDHDGFKRSTSNHNESDESKPRTSKRPSLNTDKSARANRLKNKENWNFDLSAIPETDRVSASNPPFQRTPSFEIFEEIFSKEIEKSEITTSDQNMSSLEMIQANPELFSSNNFSNRSLQLNNLKQKAMAESLKTFECDSLRTSISLLSETMKTFDIDEK